MYIIAGLFRRQQLKSPKGMDTRPTSNRLREALFNICQTKIEGARFLDLFAGSGAMGLEAVSRGALHSTFIETNREAIKCIEANVEHLKVAEKTSLLKGEAMAMLNLLERQGKSFDIIYVDPPYRTMTPGTTLFYSQQIVRWMDVHALLNPRALLFIEEDFLIPPETEQLNTITLVNTRRMGPAVLLQYQKLT